MALGMAGGETPFVPMRPVPLHTSASASQRPVVPAVPSIRDEHPPVFMLRGFLNQALDDAYTANPEICICSRPTYWNSAGTHFMYFQEQEVRWVISPRYNCKGEVDLLSHVMRGEMRGVAFEDAANTWQEFSQGAWHAVPIQFTRLVAETQTRTKFPGNIPPQQAPDHESPAASFTTQAPPRQPTQGSHIGLHEGTSNQRLRRSPQSSSSQTQQLAGSRHGRVGQVTTVVIEGFRSVCLNTTFQVDRAIAIGGRSTYWDRDRSYFMYYQASERRWAISCRDAGGGDDMLVDAQRGGIRGLAYEAQKGSSKWKEFFAGEWRDVEPRIQKLTAVDSETRMAQASLQVVPQTKPRDVTPITIKLEDATPIPQTPGVAELVVSPGAPEPPVMQSTPPKSFVKGLPPPPIVTGDTAAAAGEPEAPTSRAEPVVATEPLPPTEVASEDDRAHGTPPAPSNENDGCVHAAGDEARIDVAPRDGPEDEEEDARKEARAKDGEDDEARKRRKQEKKEKKQKKEKEMEERLRNELLQQMQAELQPPGQGKGRRRSALGQPKPGAAKRVRKAATDKGNPSDRGTEQPTSTSDLAVAPTEVGSLLPLEDSEAKPTLRRRTRWCENVSACWPVSEAVRS